MAFGDFREDELGERISEMKGDEVKAFIFFPMRKATAIANVDFAEMGRSGAVKARGRIFFRRGVILLRIRGARTRTSTLQPAGRPALPPDRHPLNAIAILPPLPLFLFFLHGAFGVGQDFFGY